MEIDEEKDGFVSMFLKLNVVFKEWSPKVFLFLFVIFVSSIIFINFFKYSSLIHRLLITIPAQ